MFHKNQCTQMKTVKLLILFAIIIFLDACEKNSLTWTLPKNNDFDIKNNQACQKINGESLDNITSYVERVSPSSPETWSVGAGYRGKGFVLNEYSYGGGMTFPIVLTSKSKMSFWTKSINSGYPNRSPIVYLNGQRVKTYVIEGDVSRADWMQMETDAIGSGNYQINIQFERISTYYSYYLDDFEFWCLQEK